MMKRTIIIALALLLATSLSAQRRGYRASTSAYSNEHNVSVEAEGGLGSLLINKELGAPTKLGIDLGGNVGYTYMFNEQSGVHTGLTFEYIKSGYTSPAVASHFREDPVTLHDNNQNYDGPATILNRTSSIDEQYTTLMFSLPIQYAYRYEWFWLNAGIRLSAPLSIKGDYTYGPSSNGIVYFERSGVSFDLDPIPYHEDLNTSAQTGSYTAHSIGDKFRIFCDVAVEFGYRFMVDKTRNQSIYVGYYIDYALNSFSTNQDLSFLTFKKKDDGSPEPVFNGALNSSAVENYKSITTGVKVYYNFGLGWAY